MNSVRAQFRRTGIAGRASWENRRMRLPQRNSFGLMRGSVMRERKIMPVAKFGYWGLCVVENGRWILADAPT